MADKKISALTGAATPLAGTEVLPIVQSGATVKVSAADVTAGRQVALSSAVAGTGLTAIPWVLNANSSFYQAGSISSIIGTAGIVGVGTELVRNAYYDSGWKYAGGGSASRLVQTGGQLINYRAVAGTADAAVTWIQNLTVDASDNATVNLGNLVIGTAGKGIDFSANTHAAGMTSELLTWYEEGTFNAQITDGTNNATMNARTCRYTRVGRQVFIHGNVSTSSVAGLSGPIFLSGLPFTISGFSAGAVGQASGLNITAGYQVALAGGNGQTRLELSVWDVATGTTLMTAAEWSDDGNIILGFTYTV